MAIIDHAPDNFKHKYETLISSVGCPKTRPLGYNDTTTTYINDTGLYRLIFNSMNKQSMEFTDWICSEVRPSIMKHGTYITKAKAIELFGLIDNNAAEALRRISNSKGKTLLHCAAVNYIKENPLF